MGGHPVYFVASALPFPPYPTHESYEGPFGEQQPV